MRYRKLAADKIFDGFQFLAQDKILVIGEDGKIESIIAKEEAGDDVENLKGILTPGFINCHCHLELSHLKGAIPLHTGLVDFLIKVVKSRSGKEEGKTEAIEKAENEMYENGIVGVADISNTNDALYQKSKSKIKWYTLAEVINFYDENLQKQLITPNEVVRQHSIKNLKAVLTPHAPYSISSETYKAINAATAGEIISIHNQETNAENQLFQTGGGDFVRLFTEFGNEVSPFAVSGKTSIQTYLPYFTNGQTILLVHNTFTSEDDIVFAKERALKYGLRLVYCLCPNANLYIENTLPPLDLLLKHNCTVVLGTDSYSSNWSLNMMSEVQTLHKAFSHLSLEFFLRSITSKAATVMRWNNELGSFERGKTPGVVLIEEEKEAFQSQRIV